MQQDKLARPRRTAWDRGLRWTALFILGAVVLAGPVYFAAEIDRIASLAVESARTSPLLVAGAIILALALDVFLPVPNGVTNTLAGAIFGFALGSVVIWIGLMAASLFGYTVGVLAARPLALKLLGEQELTRAHRFTSGIGPLVLIFSRPVPVFAELTTIASGMAGMRLGQFLMITGLANLSVATVFAAIGSAALADQSGLLAITGSVILPLIAWLGFHRWHAKQRL
jgi:uncharacterized membrane protein YdjX (TVP38/TMEM64 family)